jgi:hypothetical protein
VGDTRVIFSKDSGFIIRHLNFTGFLIFGAKARGLPDNAAGAEDTSE